MFCEITIESERLDLRVKYLEPCESLRNQFSTFSPSIGKLFSFYKIFHCLYQKRHMCNPSRPPLKATTRNGDAARQLTMGVA